MVKKQIRNSELNPQTGFKRIGSADSLSTFQEFEKSRIIPTEVKAEFIHLITNRNYSMKEAAKIVDMSYSTAKKIYGKFRKQNVERQALKVEGTIEATYKEIPDGSIKRIPIMCLIAGHSQI